MNIVKDIVPASDYPQKCPYAMTPVYVTIHNTANDASAKNEIAYMKRNPANVTYHFAVDDIEARQGLPLNRNGWHAGDGASGTGNRKTIAIEICYSKSGGSRFDKAERNGAKLAAKLLKDRGWGVDRLRKHQDWSGKHCPHRTLDKGWSRFINMVKKELEGGDDMITNHGLNVLFRFYRGDSPSSTQRKKYVGKKTFDEMSKQIQEGSVFNGEVEAAKNGELDVKSHMPREIRTVFNQSTPAPVEPTELAKGVYEVK